jgi:hypothetical protein
MAINIYHSSQSSLCSCFVLVVPVCRNGKLSCYKRIICFIEIIVFVLSCYCVYPNSLALSSSSSIVFEQISNVYTSFWLRSMAYRSTNMSMTLDKLLQKSYHNLQSINLILPILLIYLVHTKLVVKLTWNQKVYGIMTRMSRKLFPFFCLLPKIVNRYYLFLMSEEKRRKNLFPIFLFFSCFILWAVWYRKSFPVAFGFYFFALFCILRVARTSLILNSALPPSSLLNWHNFFRSRLQGYGRAEWGVVRGCL